MLLKNICQNSDYYQICQKGVNVVADISEVVLVTAGLVDVDVETVVVEAGVAAVEVGVAAVEVVELQTNHLFLIARKLNIANKPGR